MNETISLSNTDRRATERRAVGRFCERAVADYLAGMGYTLTVQSFAVKGGEIDLVAENADTILFVEVKGRTEGDQLRRFGRPALAVNAAKREHLLHAAKEYLRRTGCTKKPRLDVAEVYMTEISALTQEGAQKWMALTVRYYPAAFRG